MGNLDSSKGNLTEEECPPSANPLPTAIDVGIEGWDKAELRTGELISQIQPTVISENQRKAVVQYVQHLVRRCIGCEVFAFGSVPLKTYLSDGDIDLTAFGNHQQLTNAWANEVRSALEEEGQSKDAKFRVKDVQYIHAAEVKLVKCIVENIVVDISFNQLGGLCTLCFLEHVNLLIGKRHLFKRSIILVKAWCYYESRLLGAHHGLISTYALETLVLYIFHLFHASLRGPLEVLFRFLDYFSKFDWDNYCVSIQGPVPIASLPQIAAEQPQTDGGKLLLSKEFLKTCIDRYSDVPNGHDSNSRLFSSKFLNIVDPLRENNNLGRSVSKANFYRIRSAFGYGARKLAKILQSPEGKIAAELDCFFPITWERHASGQRQDVPDSISWALECRFSVENASFISFSESSVENDKQDTKDNASTEGNGSRYGETVGQTSNLKSETIKTDKSLISSSAGDMSIMAQSNGTDLNIVETKSDDASFKEQEAALAAHEFPHKFSPSSVVKPNLSPHYPTQNTETMFLSPKSNTETSQVNDISALSSNLSHLPMVTESTDSNPYAYQPTVIPFSSTNIYNSTYPIQPTVEVGGASYKSQGRNFENANEVIRKKSLKDQQASKSTETGPMQKIEIVVPDPRLESRSTEAVVDALSSPSSDLLTGDFENHLNNLAHGRSCQNPVWQGYIAQSPVLPLYAHEHLLWEGPGRPVHPNMSMPSHMHGRGVVPRYSYFPVGYRGANPPVLPGTFNVEEMPRPRSGTGTYLPNLNYHSSREKNFSKGKHQHGTLAHDSTAREGGAHHSSSRSQVGYNSGSSWQIGIERLHKSSYLPISHAVMRNTAVASQPGSGAPGPHSLSRVSVQEAPSFTAVSPSDPPFVTRYPFSNGTTFSSDPPELGTLGPVQFSNDRVRSESGEHVSSVLNEQSYMSGAAAPSPSASERGLQQPAAALKQDRAAPRSYQMKEEDFPPLSVQGQHKGSSATAGNGGHLSSVLNEQSYQSGAAAPLPSSSERELQQPAAALKQDRAAPRNYQMKKKISATFFPRAT